MTEPDWDAFRRRARQRAAAQMALLVGPVILLAAIVKALGPHDYPAGDMRNEPAFWIAFAVVALLLVGALMAGSIRLLRRGRDGRG